jgi:hypothetical protein
MRVSEHYQLERSQPSLDFVDVDIGGDTPVFVSPRALTLLPSQMGRRMRASRPEFFSDGFGLHSLRTK